MKCKEIKNRILLHLMDELTEVQSNDLIKHVQSCHSCRRFFEQNKKLFSFLSQGELKESSRRWETLWGNIHERVNRTRRRSWFPQPAFKWSMTFAGFLVCLILGFFIGRTVIVDTDANGKAVKMDDRDSVRMVMQNYLEDLKPLMLDLSNASLAEKEEKMDWIEEERIKSMLLRTRLLRKRYSDGNDPLLEGLLDDIELILMETDNRVPGDRQSIKSIREMIDQKDISFKVNLIDYQSKNT